MRTRPACSRSIRLFFSEIVEEVIDRKALLSVSPNQAWTPGVQGRIPDESGNATSADLGHTYRKLLCIAFDLAVLRAHLDDKFPRFVYHDGVFESLDDRKKENLLAVIRRYADLGIQPVITLIDSDLPAPANDDPPVFDNAEIVDYGSMTRTNLVGCSRCSRGEARDRGSRPRPGFGDAEGALAAVETCRVRNASIPPPKNIRSFERYNSQRHLPLRIVAGSEPTVSGAIRQSRHRAQ